MSKFTRFGGLLPVVIMMLFRVLRLTTASSTRCTTGFIHRTRQSACFVASSVSSTKLHVSQSTLLSPGVTSNPSRIGLVRLMSSTVSSPDGAKADPSLEFFAPPEQTFASIGIQSPILLQRIQHELGLTRPSAVQAAAYQAISQGGDVTIGAETGSGKTYAYLLPILDDILESKRKSKDQDNGKVGNLGYDYARAMILVPNKELVQQVVRMAVELCGGPTHAIVSTGGGGGSTGGSPNQQQQPNSGGVVVEDENVVRLAVMPGGLDSPEDFAPFRYALNGASAPVDIIISTPAAVGPLALKPKNIDLFADIQTLVMDEADMLLDGGYLRSLENVLMGFRRANRLEGSFGVKQTQHVFCAATLPDMGLRSVDAYLQKKFPRATRVTLAGMHNARHYGLRDQTVWIQDNEDGGNRERMETLVNMLNTPLEQGGLQGEKVMVFLNSVDDVDGASKAFGRAGINAVPYHAKIPLVDRANHLDRFRRYTVEKSSDEQDDTVPVLVCTDLASRGLDVPGVTAVVQLQFAGNVVAHLHRMGRCGRAGHRNGRGIVFYGSTERELVEVVQAAETQQDRMMLEGNVDDEDENDETDEAAAPPGSVKNAFSRKRGFTKKRKKLVRESRMDDQSDGTHE